MRHKLSLSLDDDDELQATVYGIISDLPDYRLAYIINQELGLRLSRTETDKKLYHKAGTIFYPEFEYHEELRMIDWCLTANNSGWVKAEENLMERTGVALVDSLRSINYFLWYRESKNDEIHRHILDYLKPNPYIRVIQEVDVEKTKNIENLIAEY